MANLKHMNNDMAVSPVVATLVLIIVAVIGAVAVGTIMGSFSSDVSDQMNSGDVSSSAATEILISGSTTVQPSSELLGKAYSAKNTGVKINVQGGGSDAGIAAIGLGVVDIGSASKTLSTANLVKYPDLIETQIGGSSVVVVTGVNLRNYTFSADAMEAIYTDADGKFGIDITTDPQNVTFSEITTGTNYTAYQRSEGSGTEDEFMKSINGGTAVTVGATIEGVTGNAGMITAVKGNANGIGFADYGFAVDAATGKTVVDVAGLDAVESTMGDGSRPAYLGATAKTLLTDPILNSLKGTAKFPQDASSASWEQTRPLMYITNGVPSGLVKDYINFVRSPEGQAPMNKAGAFHIVQFS